MTFYLQKNMNGTPCILKESYEKAESSFSVPFYHIDVFNIGLGPANTISIRWEYDQKRLVDRFTTLGRKTKLLHTGEKGHFQYRFGRKRDQRYGFCIGSPADSTRELSFLAPSQSAKVQMSESLFNFLTFIPYLELVGNGNPRRHDLKSRDFTVQLQYFDVGGKKHNQKVAVAIEVYAYAREFAEKNYGIGTITYSRY
jgi:hypothetical protein